MQHKDTSEVLELFQNMAFKTQETVKVIKLLKLLSLFIKLKLHKQRVFGTPRQNALDLFPCKGINQLLPRDFGCCCNPRQIFSWDVPGSSQRQAHKQEWKAAFHFKYATLGYFSVPPRKTFSIGGRKSYNLNLFPCFKHKPLWNNQLAGGFT